MPHDPSRRFVHYTSADTAKKIIEKEPVWMRQSRCMNDFMEVDYGIDCLKNALDSQVGTRFRT